MKKLLTLIFTIFSLSAFSQIAFTAAIPFCTGAPTGAPSASGSRFRIDLLTGKQYAWSPTAVSWLAYGQGFDVTVGGIPPAYTPGIGQSNFAVNGSNELYRYSGSGTTWDCMNCSTGATYTAGTGINIDGSNVISNTGDLSATNELITDFEVTGGSLVVSDAGGGHSVAVTDIAPIQSGLAADFNQSGSVLSLDYTNAQKATALVPGFLTAADWATFNSKGVGSVTGVGLSLPSIFSVSGSPVTTSGTLTGTLATQTANTVFAGPTSGGAATPAFRALVAADIPASSASKFTQASGFAYQTTTTDNLVIGTSTQPSSAYKLQLNGGEFIKGSGASSATNALIIQNSAGDQILQAQNDGQIIYGYFGSSYTFASDISYSIFSGATSLANNIAGGGVTSGVSQNGGTMTLNGTGAFHNASGMSFTIQTNGTNTNNKLKGMYGSARLHAASARAFSLTGGRFDANTDDASSGTVNTLEGVYAETIVKTGVTATNAYAFRVPDLTNTGTITNTYGVHIGDITTGTQTNIPYSFYASDANARSYFAGKFIHDATNTATGTTGNQTINKPSGTVNIAAGGTTVTVTNSLVTTSSIVIPVIRTNDTTATIKNVVPGSGSFVITLTAAATAEVSIGFVCYN